MNPFTNAMNRLVERLHTADIPYAIVGGMAVGIHGGESAADGVDVLLDPEGSVRFHERFVPQYYDPVPNRRLWFRDRQLGVPIRLELAGSLPGRRRVGPVINPHPKEVAVSINGAMTLDFVTLIQLSLTAGWHTNLAQVVSLIRAYQLDELFVEHLHPGLHSAFLKCLDEVRREERFEAVNG